MKFSIKEKYYTHKEIIDNLSWRIFQIFSQQGITFLIFILAAKVLTPYDFGVYTYTLTFIFLLVLFGDFGITTATSKYVAQYNLNDKDKLKSILFNSTILISSLTFIIVVLAFVLGPKYLGERFTYILYVLPLVFLVPMTALYDGVYRGLKKFKQLTIISFCVSLISVFLVYFFIKNFGLIGALIAQDIFYFILLVALILNYREFHFYFDKRVFKEVGSYSLVYGLAVVGNYLFIRSGILILGHYNYIEQIASYELINKVYTILLMPFSLVGQVVAPNFAVLVAEKQYKKIYLKAVKYTIIFFLIGLILALIFYFVLPIIFEFFFQKYFLRDYFGKTFLLCTLIYMCNVWAATFDSGILIPTGYANLMAKFYLFLGLFGVLLSVILLKAFGFLGVFMSFAISSFTMVVGLRIIYFLKINSNKNDK
jgi:O-antigen/teichoic acid export membrane protein